MLSILTDTLDWWGEVMTGLVIRRRATPRGPIVVLGRGSAFALRRAGDAEAVEIPLDAGSAGFAALRRGRGRIRGPVALRLEPDRFVTRRLTGIAVPVSRQRQMAEIDLAGATPFSRDGVHVVMSERERPGAPATYHVIRREVIDPVIADMGRAGLRVSQIWLASPGGDVPLRRSDTARLTGRMRARRTSCAMAAALGGLVVAGVVGTFLHAVWRYDDAIMRVAEQTAPLQVRAKRVRQALDEREARLAVLAALRTEIAENRTATEIWEELTRILPDSAWLTELAITPEAVRATGFSNAAPAIIAAVEASPMFRNAEFTAPVVRVPGQQGQRFSLQAGVLPR